MTKDEVLEVWQGPVRALARSMHRKYPSIEVGDIEGEAWSWLYSQGNPHRGLSLFLSRHLNQVCAQELETRRLVDSPSPVGVDWSDEEFILLVKTAMGFPFVNPRHVRDNVRPEWQPVLRRVEAALEQLNDEELELLKLRYYEEEPLREVCERFGVSGPTISRRAHAAVDKARSIFDAGQGSDDRQYVGQSLVVSNAEARRPNQNAHPVRVRTRRHGKAGVEE